jgi:hypothetical protein
MVTKQGVGTEIPGTRNVVKPEEITWKSEAIPGGGERSVPYRGRQRLDLTPSGAPQAGPSNLKPVDISLPPNATQADIDKVIKSVSNVGTPGTGGAGGLVTKFPESQVEIPSNDLPLWVNPRTFEQAPSGMTPAQARNAGYTKLNTSERDNLDGLKSAIAIVDEIKTLMPKVFPKDETSPYSPNRLLRPLGAASQTNPDATRLFNLVNGMLVPVIRTIGAKGRLPREAITRATGLMLKSTDSARVAYDTMDETYKMLGIIQASTFAGGYKNLTPAEKTKAESLYTGNSTRVGRFQVEVME